MIWSHVTQIEQWCEAAGPTGIVGQVRDQFVPERVAVFGPARSGRGLGVVLLAADPVLWGVRHGWGGPAYGTAAICGTIPPICPGSCSAGTCTSTEGNYLITLPAVDLGVSKALSATTFTILAMPVQVLDGRLSIDEKNQKQQDTNLNTVFDAGENVWK